MICTEHVVDPHESWVHLFNVIDFHETTVRRAAPPREMWRRFAKKNLSRYLQGCCVTVEHKADLCMKYETFTYGKTLEICEVGILRKQRYQILDST